MTQVIQNAAPLPASRSILSRLGHRMAERHKYGRRRDWLWGLYNRLLGKQSLSFLPFRNKVRSVHVRGITGPLYVRLGTTDWTVIDEIFMNGEYDQLLASDLGEVRQILDLGANVGFSIRLLQERFTAARIIAVEPDSGNVEACRRNVAAGPAPDRVSVIQACVAGISRQVQLDRSGGEYGFSMTDLPDRNGQTGNVVEALTIQQILADQRVSGQIDLLKCDIEGAEKEVFAQCREWIGRVNHMVVELHPPYHTDDFLGDLARNDAAFEVISRSDKGGPTVLVLRSRRVADGKQGEASPAIPAA